MPEYRYLHKISKQRPTLFQCLINIQRRHIPQSTAHSVQYTRIRLFLKFLCIQVYLKIHICGVLNSKIVKLDETLGLILLVTNLILDFGAFFTFRCMRVKFVDIQKMHLLFKYLRHPLGQTLKIDIVKYFLNQVNHNYIRIYLQHLEINRIMIICYPKFLFTNR